METTTTTGGNSGSAAQAAATAVSPDPQTASLLERHSAGQKLTPQEYGKLGAFASKIGSLFRNKTGKAGVAPGQAQPGLAAGNASDLAALSPGASQPDSLGNPPVNTDLVKRTTAAVLKSADGIAKRYIGREARKAGADDRSASRFESAASLPTASQELIVDCSPDLLQSLGVDPKNYPLTVCIGSLGLWATNIWLCVDELRAMQKEKAKETPPAPAPGAASQQSAQHSTLNPALLPIPATPKGAPPVFS